MGRVDLLDQLPRTKRSAKHLERACVATPEQIELAKSYGKEYFDGDRLLGYGGYYYDGRWKPVAKRIRDHYQLPENASILDIGCAKGFLLHDLQKLMPEATVAGLDISEYAVKNSTELIRPYLTVGDACNLPYADKSFDLVMSINTLHNLPLEDCKQAIREIERVSRRHTFIVVDAWRTPEEFEQLQKWILTAVTYLHVNEWERIFEEMGYAGDYSWCFLE
jgi:ubiquinone/menaquinone biosynthesis C-methylase UbiE